MTITAVGASQPVQTSVQSDFNIIVIESRYITIIFDFTGFKISYINRCSQLLKCESGCLLGWITLTDKYKKIVEYEIDVHVTLLYTGLKSFHTRIVLVDIMGQFST